MTPTQSLPTTWRPLLVLTALLVLATSAAAVEPTPTVGTVDAVITTEEVRQGSGEVEPLDPFGAKDFDPSDYVALPIPADRPRVGPEKASSPSKMISFDVQTRTTVERDITEVPSGLDVMPGGLGDEAIRALSDPEVGKNFGAYTHVANTTTGRFPTAVKLFMKVTDINGVQRNFVCSGTLIDPMHVITAGHCVYFRTDSNGNVYNDWIDEVRVVPAYHLAQSPSEPYGDAAGTQFHSWTGWTNSGNHDDDIGIIDLNRPVGALTGWRAYGWYGSCGSFTSGTWEHNGYPASGPYDGTHMYTDTGDFDSCEEILGIWTGNEVRFNRESFGGSSGSGAVRSDVVRAVLSNGTSSYTDDVRLTEGKFGNVGTWISDDTPSSWDLVPLDVNFSPGSIISGNSSTTFNYLVHNYSSQAVSSSSWSVSVYLSTNEFISTGDQLLGSHTFNWSFNPKSSVRVNASAFIPASVTTGSYYVGVILNVTDASTANNNTEGWDSAPVTVTCGSSATPAHVSPSNGVTCQSTSRFLDWSTVSGATQYQLQVGTSCGSGTTYSTTATSRTVSGLSNNTTYYWRMRSQNACGNWSSWSGCRSFTTTQATPGIGSLLSPASGATCQSTSTTFDWGNIANATSYQLQVGTSCGTGTTYTTSSSVRTVTGLANGVTYSWRVRGRNSCGTYGSWTSCRTMTVTPATPGVASLLSPANGSTCQSTSTTFDWSNATNATSYQLQVGTACGVGTTYTTTGSARTVSGLTNGATYFWRTRARNSCGTYGAWTACRSMTVVPVVTASTTGPASQVSLFVRPDGLGDKLSSAQLWNGVPGTPPTEFDATVGVTVTAGACGPIVGAAASRFELRTSFGGLVTCSPLIADGPTNGAGYTQFSGQVFGGGHTFPTLGDRARVYFNGTAVGSSYFIQFNSADINGDLLINLADVGEFVIDLNGPYTYRSDFFYDGVINLADVGELVAALNGGTSCKTQGTVASVEVPENLDDVIGLYFDPAGERDAVSLNPGETIEAYVLVRGPAVDKGIKAFELALEHSSNVVIDDVLLPTDALNVLESPEFVVGLGGSHDAKGQDVMRLMTVRLHVTDDLPAHIGVAPSSLRSLDYAAPVVAVAGTPTAEDPLLRGLRASEDADRPVAWLNDPEHRSVDDLARMEGPALFNAPNPFNPSTEIYFLVPEAGQAEIRIYDVAGRQVRTLRGGALGEGRHSLHWNGRDEAGGQVGSGLYFYRLFVNGRSTGQAVKMSLVK